MATSKTKPNSALHAAGADRSIAEAEPLRDHDRNTRSRPLVVRALRSAMDALRRIPTVFVVVIAVRFLLWITYPLNFMVTDGPNMYKMLVLGISDLIHAPGYPFLMGLMWRIPIELGLADNHPTIFNLLLGASQHAVNIFCLYLGYIVAREFFGRLPASIFVVLYGLHYHTLTVSSSVTSEWLQGSLFMALWYLLMRAVRAHTLGQKTAWYTACGFLFCWMYLVKFNSIAVLTLPALMALYDLWRSRKLAWVPIASSILTAVVTYAIFVVAFHQPSTGTYAITLDKGWVFLVKLGFFVPNRELSPDTGIATTRLIVLNNLLPMPKGKGPVRHVDQVPPSERAPYREKYLHLLEADQAELDALLSEMEIPSPYDFSVAFLPVSHYIGYQESNDLGIAVFLENLRRYPRAFVKDAWRLIIHTIVEPQDPWMYPIDLSDRPSKPLKWGYRTLRKRQMSTNRPVYRFRPPVVWGPGVRFFKLHYEIFRIPTLWITIVIVGGGLTAALALIRRRGDPRSPAVYLALTLTIALFILFSNLILRFRWKEVQPILPAICLLFSVSLVRFSCWLASFDQR